MALSLVYERSNKDTYDMLVALDNKGMGNASSLGAIISNDIFPTIMNKVGDTIVRSDKVDRNYAKFKMPLSEFGAWTEYLASNMIRADDPTKTINGTVVNDFVINNPDIKAAYATKNVRANYPLTVNSDRWLDAVDNGDYSTIATMVGIAMQSLYDGISHDHDSLIPALAGVLYRTAANLNPSSIRTIPTYDGTGVEAYSKTIFGMLNKAIRDMTTWRRNDFNTMGAEMSDSANDIVLVSFDNDVSGSAQNPLDVITSQLTIGAQARAKALGDALGVEVYQMPSAGIISNDIARAYSLPAFPGMQTADMSKGVPNPPHKDLKFALIGKGALNVGLKRLANDTARSARGHFDQTWVMPTLQLAYGAGQAIFFRDTSIVPK